MQKLVYTTHNDLSLEYFDGWEMEFYDTADGDKTADVVYFRDPFNDPEYQPDTEKIDRLIKSHQGAKIIDNLAGFQDILQAEDKYIQAQTYQEWSPQTWLPSEHQFVPGENLAKPRISQRAKNILFELDGHKLDDGWIIQELLDIKEELRVYTVFGEILPIASIKSSKASGHVKIIGTRELTEQETAFVKQLVERCPLDIVGYDIAVLENGALKMIEANRSPQFRRYTERTEINLVKKLEEGLEK